VNKCVYCEKRAVTHDALGLNACLEHSGEADEYIEIALRKRRTPFQQHIIGLGIAAGIDPKIFDASDHPYTCKCEKCLMWWSGMGRDPDSDSFGPFTDDEIAEYHSRKI